MSRILLPPANEVWGKLIFSEACVKNSVHRGRCAWSGGGGGVWSGGVWSGGCLLWGVSGCGVPAPGGDACSWGVWLGGACSGGCLDDPEGVHSGGCLVQGGACSWGTCSQGGSGSGGAWLRPPSGRLLLRVLRILLECILVLN